MTYDELYDLFSEVRDIANDAFHATELDDEENQAVESGSADIDDLVDNKWCQALEGEYDYNGTHYSLHSLGVPYVLIKFGHYEIEFTVGYDPDYGKHNIRNQQSLTTEEIALIEEVLSDVF